MSRGPLLAVLASVVVALVLATCLDDAAGLARLGPGCARAAAGFGWIAALGAAQGAFWPWLLARGRARPLRDALAGGLAAGAVAALLLRDSLGWLDLGPFGAGPPGELSLVTAPITQVVAVLATLGARTAAKGEREPPGRQDAT